MKAQSYIKTDDGCKMYNSENRLLCVSEINCRSPYAPGNYVTAVSNGRGLMLVTTNLEISL